MVRHAQSERLWHELNSSHGEGEQKTKVSTKIAPTSYVAAADERKFASSAGNDFNAMEGLRLTSPSY